MSKINKKTPLNFIFKFKFIFLPLKFVNFIFNCFIDYVYVYILHSARTKTEICVIFNIIHDTGTNTPESSTIRRAVWTPETISRPTTEGRGGVRTAVLKLETTTLLYCFVLNLFQTSAFCGIRIGFVRSKIQSVRSTSTDIVLTSLAHRVLFAATTDCCCKTLRTNLNCEWIGRGITSSQHTIWSFG